MDSANSSTRAPPPASSSALLRATSTAAPDSSANKTSGAPSSQLPWSTNAAADHFRADENGTDDCVCQPGAGYSCATAARVGFGEFSDPPNAPSTASVCDCSASSRVTSSLTAIPGSVSVPVLSTQTTSTRAKTSTAGISCTNARFCPNRTTATAIATLVSRTKPSGTIVTTPATVPDSASCHVGAERSCEMNNRVPSGISTQVIVRTNRMIEPISSDLVVENVLASAVSFVA